MVKKVILTGSDARRKLISGALKVSNILGSTLGPRGRNAIIQTAYSAPNIVNDAGTIARHIYLSDPTEDLGAQTIVESTMKTNDRAGDARTTTAVLAGKIIEVASKKINDQDEGSKLAGITGADVIALSRSILDSRDIVIEKLKSSAHKLKKGELKNVVSTSIGKLYPEFIEQIADMVEEVGVNGYVSVEDNWGTKYGVDTTLIKGLRFLGSYAAPVFITNDKKEAIYEDVPILVTNHVIESSIVFGDLIKEMRAKDQKKLIIIAERFEKEFLFQIVSSYMRQAQAIAQGQITDMFKFILIKAPTLTTDQFEDVAVFCDAVFFDKNKGNNDLSKVRMEHLGFAKKIVIDEDDTNITGARGNVEERLKLLQSELDIEKDTAFKEQLKRRIGAMASGFGIIRVGASTETERTYIKKKITDAVNSAKGALEEGVVKGGGLALKDIADELGKENILFEALNEPNRIITESTGGEKIPNTVVDSLKSTRLAVENACSVAAHLITCDTSIADVREDLWGQLSAKLAPSDNDDMRAEENQELNYRT